MTIYISPVSSLSNEQYTNVISEVQRNISLNNPFWVQQNTGKICGGVYHWQVESTIRITTLLILSRVDNDLVVNKVFLDLKLDELEKQFTLANKQNCLNIKQAAKNKRLIIKERNNNLKQDTISVVMCKEDFVNYINKTNVQKVRRLGEVSKFTEEQIRDIVIKCNCPKIVVGRSNVPLDVQLVLVKKYKTIFKQIKNKHPDAKQLYEMMWKI